MEKNHKKAINYLTLVSTFFGITKSDTNVIVALFLIHRGKSEKCVAERGRKEKIERVGGGAQRRESIGEDEAQVQMSTLYRDSPNIVL